MYCRIVDERERCVDRRNGSARMLLVLLQVRAAGQPVQSVHVCIFTSTGKGELQMK
jgi:hypothetical protein